VIAARGAVERRSAERSLGMRAGTERRFTWITPICANSDHTNCGGGYGPSWVAALVNTIGESKFWNSTAIFVQWDDWGRFSRTAAGDLAVCEEEPRLARSLRNGERVTLRGISSTSVISPSPTRLHTHPQPIVSTLPKSLAHSCRSPRRRGDGFSCISTTTFGFRTTNSKRRREKRRLFVVRS
jgi:Phosphoesterase family